MNRNLKNWLHGKRYEAYEGLEMVWQQGHNPELHVDGEVIDLNGFDDAAMARTLGDKGFEEA